MLDAIIASTDILDILGQLIDKSIVQVIGGMRDTRYRLLETMHQYALARLRETDEDELLKQRHWAWYLALVEQAAPALWVWAKESAASAWRANSAIFGWLWHGVRLSWGGRRPVSSLDSTLHWRTAWLTRLSALVGLCFASGKRMATGEEGGRWLGKILDATSLLLPFRVDALNAAVYLAGVRGDLSMAEAQSREAATLAHYLDYPYGAYLAAILSSGIAMSRGDASAAQVLHSIWLGACPGTRRAGCIAT